ncbi:resistin-like beta [Mauremys reevesii]|uniref:resistin-like beta n=1 Tax=Mauremys reevesii TaxID=260615 RepID=UPI00193F52B7|nr:resistin-like beta [Mauremys reevesii]
MEMNNIYVNHEAVARSPGGRMKRTSPKPAGHGAVEFSDDEMSDYENISVTTDQKNPQPPAEMPPSDPDRKMTEELRTINAAISQRIDQDQKMTEELKRINAALSHRINEVSSTLAKAKLLCQNVWANGALVSCPAGYKPTGCACGMGCGSWDIHTDSTCHCRCSGIDWTSARCCKIGL